eukprot:10410643-Alexandrium_andersonii.AAC.1
MPCHRKVRTQTLSEATPSSSRLAVSPTRSNTWHSQAQSVTKGHAVKVGGASQAKLSFKP